MDACRRDARGALGGGNNGRYRSVVGNRTRNPGHGKPWEFDSSTFRQPPLAQSGQSCALLMRGSGVQIPHGGRVIDSYRGDFDKVADMESDSKRCSRCGYLKPVDQFARNRGRKDGLGTYCKGCTKSYNAAYYQDTKERHNPGRAERRRSERKRQTDLLIEYLREHPCVDCGESDIVVLQFDHVTTDKRANIADLVNKGVSWDSVVREIGKCEVVCANDHQRRTARRSGWRKLPGPGIENVQVDMPS